MTYSVYARDRKSGREYALPTRYFGNFPTISDAEVALAWYLETSSSAAHELVDVYIRENAHKAPEPLEQVERELIPA